MPNKTRLDLVTAALDQHKESISKRQRSEVRAIKPQTVPADNSNHTPVRAWLQDANLVKRAFLTAEILGTPVALRQNGKMGPCWNQ